MVLVFLFHPVQEPFNGEKNITGLEKYMNQIDTIRYGDYTSYFCKRSSIQRASDMIVTCASLFQGQHKQITKIIYSLM